MDYFFAHHAAQGNGSGYNALYKRRHKRRPTLIDLGLRWKVRLEHEGASDMLCTDLKTGPIADANVLLVQTEYWAPLLLLNPHYAGLSAAITGAGDEGLFK